MASSLSRLVSDSRSRMNYEFAVDRREKRTENFPVPFPPLFARYYF